MTSSCWYVYMLECVDGTYYTGITTDVKRRLSEHESGKGAKYTRGRGPLELVYTQTFKNRSEASKQEYYLKSLSRSEKLTIIGQP